MATNESFTGARIKKSIRFLSYRSTVKSIVRVADHAARIAIKSMEIHSTIVLKQ